jgi:heme-degrading monooxygenase HmoA
MHCRVVTFNGAENIDAGISFIRERLLPVIGDQKGYRGLAASADRGNRVLAVITMWDTEAERDASWDSLEPSRDQGRDVVGGEMTVDNYEVLMQELGAPPGPDSALLLLPVSMDPARIDEHLEYYRREIAPQIKAAPGFQALRVLVNRATGQGVSGSVWADEAAMRAAAQRAEAGRADAASRGVQLGELDFRQMVVNDLH